ncbi:leucyl aminopeptidase [Devriesea agamarum]|uniref:leucyl aminopeptidase n=1 Tax=Devriesea agamarum TaxID=472569 RepID=UPI00071E1CE8|nr:leucyl aminopeptidase [Devriesea agamarum]
MTQLTVTTSSVASVATDVLILPVLTDPKGKTGGQVLGPKAIQGAVKGLGVRGTAEEIHRIPSYGIVSAPAIVLVGLGASDVHDVSEEDLRRAFGAATRSLSGSGFTSAAVAVPGGTPEQHVAAAEGAVLGAYAFTVYRSQDADSQQPVGRIEVVAPAKRGAKALKLEIERSAVLADGVHLVRNLVNIPPNLLYPESFAERARQEAGKLPIKVTVLDENALSKGGYGGILGVGQGSSRPPRLVRLDYSPRKAQRHVAIVGKGITFDTGGISIKPAAGMDEMTSDMAGAATALATVVTAARLALPVHVTVYLAIAENMPDGNAQRPGDVVTMRNGKTVEVLNTDAEGRMVMADALCDAVADGPDLVLDIATLTGAAVIALGSRTAAVMGTQDGRDAVMAAANLSGEPFWPLPFPSELRSQIKGRVADLSNIGKRPGGALSAGVFLSEFVGDTTWAHVDIAGPAFGDAPHGYTPKGATGFALRTLIALLENAGADAK